MILWECNRIGDYYIIHYYYYYWNNILLYNCWNKNVNLVINYWNKCFFVFFLHQFVNNWIINFFLRFVILSYIYIIYIWMFSTIFIDLFLNYVIVAKTLSSNLYQKTVSTISYKVSLCETYWYNIIWIMIITHFYWI